MPSSSIGTTVAKKQSEKSENFGDHDLVTGRLLASLCPCNVGSGLGSRAVVIS